MKKFFVLIIAVIMCLALASCDNGASGSESSFEIPEYAGEASVEINGGEPQIAEKYKTEDSFESYGALDRKGRCTTCIANLSEDTRPGPDESRGDISSIHPSGWRGGQGWERCHLIAWTLSGENENKSNLVTGTHYLNVEGMLPYEEQVAKYISETGNHVVYEVTPVFEGKNQVCSGVHMQAESVEDRGRGISYNVFCFNVSPGYEIDYRTGKITVSDRQRASEKAFKRTYVLNKNSMKFHYPSCSSVNTIAEHNKETVNATRDMLIKQGYEPCGSCEP